jgi:hypothetical protein
VCPYFLKHENPLFLGKWVVTAMYNGFICALKKILMALKTRSI